MLWLLAGGLVCCGLMSSGFGLGADLSHHYYLTNAFARALAEGEWVPRWAGVLDGGRGDAVFTFYSPLFYWLSGGLVAGFGVDTLTALKSLLFASFVVAPASAYLLAREFFGVRASILAALTYVLLPAYPHLALHRGFLSNALALSLVPLALLGAYRLLSSGPQWGGHGPGLVIFAFSFGAIILIHSITAYLCSFPIALMAVCCRAQAGWQGLRRLSVGVLMALSMTAFFQVPQLLEMKWVQADLELTQHHYRNYFLFAEAADTSRYRQIWAGINDIVSVMTLALAALVLLLGVAAYRMMRRSGQSPLWWWCTGLALVGLFISLPVSDSFWRYIPGLKFIQFPWRFQPFVALGGALLAAATVEGWKQNDRRRKNVLAAAGTWLVVANLVFTFLLIRPSGDTHTGDEVSRLLHPEAAVPLDIGQVDALREKGDLTYLAYTANRIPFRPRGADFTLYPPTDRIGGLSIIAGRGQVVAQGLGNSHRQFNFVNEGPVSVRVETYHYPNWVARIDGRPVRSSIEQGSGLMLIDVPSGTHSLTLDFEITQPVERWARTVSAIAGLILISMVFAGGNRFRFDTSPG
ncbi:MAG TPA: 6-pyruvoyl-tetrahydropterin synthase-related protein [Blastocatellia bacterium]|nr:6-pyruvoyl-tetrahydropterin synthase-related protein [Blastocatellia bacterium]